jgi:alpha-beta hydrolase superfamily lysophospholipase/SAM-dependent methyltransferase
VIARLKSSEHTMATWDGVELFYRAWQPERPTDKALLIFHRGHEHSGRMTDLVDDLALEDFNIFAWDARGHGRSPGERGYADDFSVLVKDVDAFVRFISQRHAIPIENMAVLAHSVGAVTVSAWIHDYAPPLRALILGTPAFRVKLYVPFAIPGLRLKRRLLGKGYVKSYVKAKLLTHDSEQAATYHQDEFIFRQIADNILLDLYDVSTRVVSDAGAIHVPTLLLSAGSDWVVKLSTQKKFFERLSSPVKQMEVFPGFYHAIFHEKERRLPIATAREFILDMFHKPPARSSLIDADREGYTKAEYDRLSKPSGSWQWPMLRLAMKTVGRLSEGVRLGWEAGFDSGVTLDYVYRNRPQGITPLGRLIDRAYLDSIGWRGIRQRKIHLEKLLTTTIQRTHAESKPVRLLDIAAGPGRYVLEAIKKLPNIPITALLRDYNSNNLEAGRKLARELTVENVTFQQGDAFDRDSLAAISPRPTIAVVSGLYELFPDNGMVLNSLRGLADALGGGGYLIYTNQPWHPQVEFIARVLTNREGKPWVMRRRTQAEMDELARAAGFEKLAMEIDEWGIFSVSLAERR